MKITTMVSLGEQEVEVSVTSEDIANVLAAETAEATEDGTEHNVLRAVSVCAQFLKGIPDELISGMAPSTRLIVTTFLREQSARFAAGEEAVS